MLHLDRPLAILDLEATGTDPEEARILQVALRLLEPAPENSDHGNILCDPFIAYVDVDVPIPERVQELTGITPETIEKHGSSLAWVLSGVTELLEGADVAGYNVVTYDWPLLCAEYERAGQRVPGPEDRSVVDAYRLEKRLRPRTLEAVHERRTGEPLEGAHDARADVDGTVSVLLDQVEEHGPCAPSDLEDFQRGDYLDSGERLKETPDGVQVCFGKHSGKLLSEIDPGYIRWMRRAIDDLRPHLETVLDGETAESYCSSN